MRARETAAPPPRAVLAGPRGSIATDDHVRCTLASGHYVARRLTLALRAGPDVGARPDDGRGVPALIRALRKPYSEASWLVRPT